MSADLTHFRTAYVGAACLVLAANVLTMVPLPLYGRLVGCAILFCLLPGALLISWIFAAASPDRQPLPLVETVLLGSGMSYFLTSLVMLLLS